MRDTGYRFLDHTADVSVEAQGKTLEEAFEQTAYSLMETITPSFIQIIPEIAKYIKIEAEDKEALLFDFLTEFLYLFDVEELIFSEIKIHSIKNDKEIYQLEAEIKGGKFDKTRHEVGIEVKAITYSFMKIEEKKKNVIVNIVFDI